MSYFEDSSSGEVAENAVQKLSQLHRRNQRVSNSVFRVDRRVFIVSKFVLVVECIVECEQLANPTVVHNKWYDFHLVCSFLAIGLEWTSST